MEERSQPLTARELRAGFRLRDCLIQPAQNRIVRPDAEVHLEPRVMEVLVCLAEHAGDVVSRETIFDRVWGDVVVTDQAVTNCISELRQHLRDDRAAARFIETVPKRGYRLVAPVEPGTSDGSVEPAGGAGRTSSAKRQLPLTAGLMLLLAVAPGIWWWARSAGDPGLTSVAVLPFENAAGDEDLDYLRLALPDEIATLLTRSRDLAVRPFEYGEGANPLVTARERQVEHVVRGRFYREIGDRLTLAVEAQHVDHERLVWRARITAPEGDLLAMRERIAERVRQGLLPALGVVSDPVYGPVPVDDEAYRLYLRSLSIPRQPKPTERAIALLEQAVELDPNFASAWDALGLRYYEHGTYGQGGLEARQRSQAAYRRALELDPELISAARQLVTFHTEAGELDVAYREARRLVEQFGETSEAHFAVAYVYRFGGMLEAAQRHCELALDRDPHDARLRSCAYAYLYDGRLERVPHFLALDEGSYFVNWATVLYHLRRKDDVAALNASRQAAPEPTRELMEACLQGSRGGALDEPVKRFVHWWQQHGDSEIPYALAPMLAYCGRPDDAIGFLEWAADSNFCAYPALDRDPIWEELRGHPEFERVRSRAMDCHERFRRVVEAASIPLARIP